MSLIGSIRKRRTTKAEIKEFAKWALKEQVYDKYTCGRIKQMYKDLTNVELSECCIRLQKKKWVLINDQVFDVNKPELFPKEEHEESKDESIDVDST